MLGTSILDNCFEKVNVLTRFQTASHILLDNDLKGGINVNDCIIDAKEP